MSTVITKNHTIQLVVGFDTAGCKHALTTGGGIICMILESDHVACKQTAETCEAFWDVAKTEDSDEGGWVKYAT